MSEWEFSDFASKENLLRTVREQSDQMLGLAAAPGVWEAPTASGHWQVRDIIGHLVDTTEGYFAAIDIARSGGTAPGPLGVRGMDAHADQGALAFRGTSQDELLARLDKDRAEMLAIIEGFDAEQWGGFLVPHKYMGPLPACFYPVAQLVDYTVHTWDIRQGSGASHAMDGDAADLLVPFCFIVWQSTSECEAVAPFSLGVRLASGHNAGDTRVSVSPEGIALEPGSAEDLPLVLEFDAASFVLTAMGRINGGTARGDAALAERFCNLFFRI
jgi:uncharacterized protein (TIGR03083 family)